jgi:hypothetical protein
MATRGQTHNKRARELALKERRERKQAKKEARAAGEWPPPTDDDGVPYEPDADGDTPGADAVAEVQEEASAEPLQ